MRTMCRWIVTFAFLICALGHVQAEEDVECGDIDSTACLLMAKERPDLCTDPVLANTTCPGYCNLCPISCYDCQTTSTDFHNCSSIQCAAGEWCMTKSLQSMVDGHREYQLSCESKQHCDGQALSLTFGVGRRSLESRDISISCCTTDLCNRPPGMTSVTSETLPPGEKTTHAPIGTHHGGCRRDITFVIDDGKRPNVSATDVRHFLKSIVHGLNIGQNGSLVSLITYAHNNVSRHWHLNTYMNSQSLSQAITNTKLFNSHAKTDLNTALDYLVKHKSTSQHSHDDRPNPDNVVILLTSHDANSAPHLRDAGKKLQAIYQDVVAIGLSGHVTRPDLRPVATDSGHEFIVGNTNNLQHIVPKVLQLICG